MSVQPRDLERPNNTPLLRWIVGAGVVLLALHLALVVIWGRGYFPGVLPWFAAAADTVSALVAIAIAFVAFGRYQVLRDPSSYWIGVAFCGFALFAVFYILSLPGLVMGDRAILPSSDSTASWFSHLKFTSLAVLLLVAAVAAWPRRNPFFERYWLGLVVATILLGAGAGWLIVLNQQLLPLLVVNGSLTLLSHAWSGALLVAFAAGMVFSVQRYRQTGDSLFGWVALTQLLLAFVMFTELVGTRLYDVWWYWGRVVWIAGFSTMLFGLLAEYVMLFRREQARARELEALQHVTGALVHEIELPRVAEVIVSRSVSVLGLDVAAVWLVDPSRQELVLAATHGLSPSLVERLSHKHTGIPILGAMARRFDQGQLQVIEDVAASDLPPLEGELILGLGIPSMVKVPLRARERLVGIVAYGSRSIRRFSPSDLAFITTTADLFAVAIDNARLYDEVRRTLQLREEFMAAAAHELRSPVAVIKGRTQLTLKNDAREEEARAALEAILRASERIARLTDDLLAVIRVRPNLIHLNRERFDLSELTRSVADQVGRTTTAHRFRIKVAAPLIVDVDPVLIREVLNRFLENALRYEPEGGVIDVETCRQDSNAVVSVTDHGVGIPVERQAHVFEPFYESIGPGTPGYVGLVSLGLYLSKQIVDAHGGRIWFASDPKKGSTFSFSLPLDVCSTPS